VRQDHIRASIILLRDLLKQTRDPANYFDLRRKTIVSSTLRVQIFCMHVGRSLNTPAHLDDAIPTVVLDVCGQPSALTALAIKRSEIETQRRTYEKNHALKSSKIMVAIVTKNQDIPKVTADATCRSLDKEITRKVEASSRMRIIYLISSWINTTAQH
jgi:hypothetical protein